MSRAHQIDRHIEREEERLAQDYAAGRITRADYNEGLRELQREARDAYQADMDDAADRVRDEWGGY
jgi:hypothetical protein